MNQFCMLDKRQRHRLNAVPRRVGACAAGRLFLVTVCSLSILHCLSGPIAAADGSKPAGHAFLVGISYSGLSEKLKDERLKLDCTINDVVQLNRSFKKAKYRTELLTDDSNREALNTPSKGNIESRLRDFMKPVRKGELVVFVFCGHGCSVRTDNASSTPENKTTEAKYNSFLWPMDAVPGRPDTWLKVSELFKELSDSSHATVVFLDACRAHVARPDVLPPPNNGSGTGNDSGTDDDGTLRSPKSFNSKFGTDLASFSLAPEEEQIAEDMVVFCSCKDSEVARESIRADRHGLFTYTILKGLSRQADKNGDRKVTVKELDFYISEEMPKTLKKYGFPEKCQSPHTRSKGSLNPVLIPSFALDESFKGLDLRKNSEFRALLKSGRADLSYYDFSGCNLAGLDLNGARMDSSSFEGAILTDAIFAGTKLIRCNFTSAKARGADFSAAILTKANLSDADFDGVDFTEAELAGVIVNSRTSLRNSKSPPAR